jgi:RNA polymerase sigma-70 factor (ECF subfamily)
LNEKNNIRTTDQHLVERILSGDTNAFTAIIKDTERLVAQIVFKMITGNEDRKDIAQDTYLKAFHKLSSFKFQSKISTWIAQIAYNNCVNFLEKKQFVLIDTNKQYNDDDKMDAMETLTDSIDLFTSDPEKMIFKKQLSQILAIEINLLSPVYKTLVTLYHNEALSYYEIGQITGLPEGTVKSYLFRARKQLRENLLRTYKKEAL